MDHAHHPHGHVDVHLDEADWAALAASTELEGEVLLAYVTQTAGRIAALRGADAPPVRRVLDIGSGPGVGTCELARMFAEAEVVAVDGSAAMLERVMRRATERGLDARVRTHRAELPAGLDSLGGFDVIWASMSLHHVGDEVTALRALRERLEPEGLLAVAEVAEPMRVLPDTLDVGTPELADRLERVEADWFAAMRAGLTGHVPSADLSEMFDAAGLEVVVNEVVRERLDPPLGEPAREFVVSRLGRTLHQLGDVLTDDDRRTLDILRDPDDPRSVMQRDDVFIASSRRIVIGRPIPRR